MTKISKKFSKKTPSGRNSPKKTPRSLSEACEGLVYISETDSPIITFAGPGVEEMSATAAAAAAGIEFREPVETVALTEFFARLSEEKDWFGETEKKNAARFRELQAALESTLSDLTIFRFGKVRIDIVVAGLDVSSRIAGIKTSAVET
jgi:hypothetical protein